MSGGGKALVCAVGENTSIGRLGNSNKLVKAAVGYVESLGFKARCKPDLLPGAYAADNIVN